MTPLKDAQGNLLTGSDTLITGGDGDDYISSGANIEPGRQQFGPQDQWDLWGLPAGSTTQTSGATWGVYKTSTSITDKVFIWSGATPTNTNTASSEGDVIDAGAGNDFINADGLTQTGYLNSTDAAHHGNDFVDGGEGADTLIGGGGADEIFGGAGDDTLYGGAGIGLGRHRLKRIHSLHKTCSTSTPFFVHPPNVGWCAIKGIDRLTDFGNALGYRLYGARATNESTWRMSA